MPSEHIHRYQEFFKDVAVDKIQDHLPHLQQMKIEYLSKSFASTPNITIMFTSQNFQVVDLSVHTGHFVFSISIYNEEGSSLTSRSDPFASGTYAKIYKSTAFNGEPYIIKNQKFSKNVVSQEGRQRLLNDIILDYCLTKLCSALGIGAAVATLMGFDLIFYDDSVEYMM